MSEQRPTLLVTPEELDRLLEYSTSLPTGTQKGKRWKRNIGNEIAPTWIIGEYGEPYPDPRNARLGRDFGELVPITWYDPVFEGDEIPCELCGRMTRHKATKRCDRCWELEKRIQDDPQLAAQILFKLELKTMRVAVCGRCRSPDHHVSDCPE